VLIVPLIERKRDGGTLKPEEWSELIRDYSAGRIPDYQMSALLMAAFINGIERDELVALTDAMLSSGSRLSLDGLEMPVVDKHSTGGVGDKVSLVLAPLVAACGVAVPMMSGRGLGHTGGTLDKLEAIPGFRTDIPLSAVAAQVRKLGCCMFGQTAEIAPADRKIYALRDVTGTVESIPLISASIMSKKLAEGLHGLVLDVKRGSGAFLTDLDDAILLAQTMIQLGEDRGCRTVALLTAMDRPLGEACGNALETAEAIACLKGEGPGDLWEVTVAEGVEMLVVAGVTPDLTVARGMLEHARTSGLALEKFREVIEAQHGDPRVIDDPGMMGMAPFIEEYAAKRAGIVSRLEPRTIGRAIVAMGGGRQRVEDPVDPAVGFVFHANPGDRIGAGQSIAAIHARDEKGLEIGRAALDAAVTMASARAKPSLPLISHRITAAGVQVLE
jgi:pyrimidine-nucleoside phosphorylase